MAVVKEFTRWEEHHLHGAESFLTGEQDFS